MKKTLDVNRLYLGDNGRCFCGEMRCAGMTAFFSGKDISGQRLYRLRPKDDKAPGMESAGFRCETCGKRQAATTCAS
jgi:hypothetical protein